MPATRLSSETCVFPENLLPKPGPASLASHGLTLRPLSSNDYKRGHLPLLSVLTSSPDVGERKWEERFEVLKKINDATPGEPTYFVIVIAGSEEGEEIVLGTGTLFVERKFLRGLGNVGHIEDIAVSQKAQGKGLGKIIIEALVSLSESFGITVVGDTLFVLDPASGDGLGGCYKTILNCSEKNISFYEKCGFAKKEVEMAKYAPAVVPSRAPSRAGSPARTGSPMPGVVEITKL